MKLSRAEPGSDLAYREGYDYTPLWRVEYRMHGKDDTMYISEYDLDDVLAVVKLVMDQEYVRHYGHEPDPSDWQFWCDIKVLEQMPGSIITPMPYKHAGGSI